MPVRLRITLLFTLLVVVILALVCGSVYYFSHTSRIQSIKTRLTNRALTTARLLGQSEIFDRALVSRIDSSTTIALNNKIVKAYDYKNRPIYWYSDVPGDSLTVSEKILNEARVSGNAYFSQKEKEAVAHHYTSNNLRIVMVVAAEDEVGKKNLQRLLQFLLLSFLGGVVIAFTGGYLFSKGLLRPIKNIADNVNEISAHNLTRRIEGGHVRDEWTYLTNTLNALLNRLQESFDLQKRFIANASHELLTPLTTISSQIEVSLQRDRPAEEYRKVMQSIHHDVRQMGKLTQVLLAFAKAAESPEGLELSPVRIDEVLMSLPSEVVKLNKTYSVSLQFDELPEEEELLVVHGNEELLFTAIKNIVVNACKYSDNHHAQVTLKTATPKILIAIQDTGSGIPEAEKENIFQPFYRLEESRTTKGFGLGLSLAHRIVKLHQGEISVQSEVGVGTTFVISLPVA